MTAACNDLILAIMRSFLSTLLLFCVCLFAEAQLKPARVFGDHMVLQRNQPVPVWGTAGRGEKVTVRFNGQSVSTKANARGDWKVVLQPMKEGGPYAMDIAGGKETLQYSDVMLGEVWLCSGQSNMEFVLQNALGYKAEQKVARQENIRQFLVPHKMSLTPRIIDNYRDILFEKLEVKSRVGLAIYAVKNGIVTL